MVLASWGSSADATSSLKLVNRVDRRCRILVTPRLIERSAGFRIDGSGGTDPVDVDSKAGAFRSAQRGDGCNGHQLLRVVGELLIERDQRVCLELGQSDVLGDKRVGPPELVGDRPCAGLKDPVSE
jgi:hypothetical protein